VVLATHFVLQFVDDHIERRDLINQVPVRVLAAHARLGANALGDIGPRIKLLVLLLLGLADRQRFLPVRTLVLE
jgi:hypothetical protein